MRTSSLGLTPFLLNSSLRLLVQRASVKGLQSASSKEWLARQTRDQFVKKAAADHFRARSAYKLQEIDDKHKIFFNGANVLGDQMTENLLPRHSIDSPVARSHGTIGLLINIENPPSVAKFQLDCGAAPGSWMQVAIGRVQSPKSEDDPSEKKPGGIVIGIDLLKIKPLKGAHILQIDITGPETLNLIRKILGGQPLHVVMSDMAPNFSGDLATDHARQIALAEKALDAARTFLVPGGTFVTKIIDGPRHKGFHDQLGGHFAKVHRVKPHASRRESAEFFIVAKGFKGPNIAPAL